MLHWYASYKEPHFLDQIHVAQMFHALINEMNKYSEMFMHFHVVSDGHNQFQAAIGAFLDTLSALVRDMHT